MSRTEDRWNEVAIRQSIGDKDADLKHVFAVMTALTLAIKYS